MTTWPEGTGRVILDETDSTNAEARRRAEAGATGPLWIMARRQTAARGRQGRAWAAPAGNLSATLLTPCTGGPARAVRLLAPVAGLAAADLAAAHLPPGRVALKWPNDVLAGGRKLAGILIESVGPPATPFYAVGIGMNLAHHPAPEETRLPATSIAAEIGAEIGAAPDPEAALTRLAAAFAAWAALGQRDHGALVAAWRGRLAGIGRPIEARLGTTSVRGIFDTVDANGRLVLRTPSGLQTISAADVFLAE